MTEEIRQEVDRVQLLVAFTQFCDTHQSESEKRRIRRILQAAVKEKESLRMIFLHEQSLDLVDEQTKEMIKLVKAYLDKLETRKAITHAEKERIARRQNYICPICKGRVDANGHLDHIIPFKYVGDQLGEENEQMLCCKCNLRKSSKIDYQLLELLKAGGKK